MFDISRENIFYWFETDIECPWYPFIIPIDSHHFLDFPNSISSIKSYKDREGTYYFNLAFICGTWSDNLWIIVRTSDTWHMWKQFDKNWYTIMNFFYMFRFFIPFIFNSNIRSLARHKILWELFFRLNKVINK